MEKIRIPMAISALTLIVTTTHGCKTAQNNELKQAGEPPPAAADSVDPKIDNQSAAGGLLGSPDVIPDGEPTPRFTMNQSFPSTPDFLTSPPPVPDLAKIQGADRAAAKQAAKAWLDAMQVYLYEDMNDQSTDLNRTFRLNGGGEISRKRWYLMPWMHNIGQGNVGGNGREPLWGLTRETINLQGPLNWPVRIGSRCLGQEWGLGYFNEPGGYAIGQVFPKGDTVDMTKARFPKRTVSVKLLFATADVNDVPELATSMKIRAMVVGDGSCRPPRPITRSVVTMHHLQMDVMYKFGDNIRDWLFGVYIHNPNKIDDGSGAEDTYWQGMEPLGVQWGNQPNQTVLVSDDLQTNGGNGRLNGPADGRGGSCYGCHQAGVDFSFEFNIARRNQARQKSLIEQNRGL